ncbi:MAG: hypothetical protein HY958_07040 [Bacteroidia bacterium]|nr:hypothetical protein [Bacteroidia bacterium]
MKKLFKFSVLNFTICILSFNFAVKSQSYSFCPGDTITHDLPVYTGSLQWQETTDTTGT